MTVSLSSSRSALHPFIFPELPDARQRGAPNAGFRAERRNQEMRRMGTRKKLKSDEDIACCLNDAYNNDDPATFVVALDDIAKIKGVGYVAKKTGLDRESLYKALSGKTKPQRDTIHSILEKQA